MATQVEMGKRRSPQTAVAIGVCLIVAGLVGLPIGMFFKSSLRPHATAVKLDLPPAAPSTPNTMSVAAAGASKPQQGGSSVVIASPSQETHVPTTAGRVLAGVAQLALAIPESSHASTLPQTAETADSRILKEHFTRLKAGRAQFSRLAGYTATMAKQERVGSDLLEEITYGVKVRQQPFSVYLKWQTGAEAGKEVLYVDGTNENQLLVHLGGIKGRILPALKIDPFGSLALAHSRYPITKLGILALADTLIDRRELEMRENVTVHVEQRPDADVEGRRCAVYIFEDTDPAQSPVYRKSVQYIDQQWNVPLRVANYTWPEPGKHLDGPALDEATLIEYYMYSEVAIDAHLTDADFDRANEEYRFHR
jgi:Protein of unknown function (DUF1571)